MASFQAARLALYSFLLHLLHFLLSCKSALTEWTRLRTIFSFIGLGPAGSKSPKPLSMSQIETLRSLSKLPIHIGIVLVEQEIILIDLANIVVWCMTLGISYITIYDRTGFCKKKRCELESTVRQQKEKLLGSRSSNYHQYFHCRGDPPLSVSRRGNQQTDIGIVSSADGMQDIVETTQLLSMNLKDVNNIQPTYIDSLLHEKHGFPDPDLILKFGTLESLLGFLPWQIRLSEIISVPTHHNMDYSTFHKSITFFSCKEQRFGR